MKYMTVRIGDILMEGPDAGRFSFAFEPETGELADSIKEMGLINPPTLRENESAFEVVCGFRRVLACKQIGMTEIDVRVYEPDELSDERCLWINLIDNGEPCRMSPAECAVALRKFSEQGYAADRLAEEIAPGLALPSSRKYIENCLRIFSLEDEILRAIHKDSLGVEQAFCLYQLEADVRLAVFRVLRSCRANLNETRELVSLIPDVAAMARASVPAYIDAELAPIIEEESLSPRKKLERIRNKLRDSRYPRLTEAESAFKAAVKKINLDERCAINAPKNFEGDEISLSMRAENADQLVHLLNSMSNAGTVEAFRRLFSIVQSSDNS